MNPYYPVKKFTFEDITKEVDKNEEAEFKAYASSVKPDAVNNKSASTTKFQGEICTHWLRGICTSGNHCKFLHEYNIDKMSL